MQPRSEPGLSEDAFKYDAKYDITFCNKLLFIKYYVYKILSHWCDFLIKYVCVDKYISVGLYKQ